MISHLKPLLVEENLQKKVFMTRKRKLHVKSDERKNGNILNDNNTLAQSTQGYCKEVIWYFNTWGNVEPK